MNTFKKILTFTALFTVASAISASAATVEFQIGNTEFASEQLGVVSKNTIEAAPFINESSRTMVPLRAISDAFSTEIAWDDATKTVTFTTPDKKINLTIGSQEAYVNDVVSTLDCAPVILADRTFVPVRFVSESLGYNVNYVSATKHIVIDDTPIVASCGDKKVSLAELKTLYQIYSQNVTDSEELTEEEIFYLVRDTLLNDTLTICYLSNAFSDFAIDNDDIEGIKTFIDETSKQVKVPTTEGLYSLALENFYMWSPENVVSKIMKTYDLKEIYENDYICAKHVLVADEQTAKTVYDKAVFGEDFDALIKEYGQDPGMSQNPDGYIFTKGEMVEEFEKCAFELEVGKISEPVKTDYGYHIIKKEALPEYNAELSTDIAIAKGDSILLNSPQPEFTVSTEELLELLK